jgi:hypothetical protein
MINGRIACAMTVGQKMTDGIMPFPSGFLPREIVDLQARYPIIGKETEFPEQKKKALTALKEARKREPKPKPTPKSAQQGLHGPQHSFFPGVLRPSPCGLSLR